MQFDIRRGTNISEWLSQSSRRGAERASFFTSKDVAFIANLGFDHIRLPVDEEQMWDPTGQRDPEAFSLLDAALDWCAEYGLKAIVDLHILRSHYFVTSVEPKLFTEPGETQRFAKLWQDLSAFLYQRPVTQVAYELLNEPVASDPRDWNRVAMAGFQAIRQREPQRPIILGSNTWNQTHTFAELEIPKDDHLILTFHYYRPMLITHYQATWWEGGFWAGPVHYPGQPISADDLRYLNPAFLARVPQWSNEVWNRERILEDFQLPLQVARQSGCPLFCGEWGAYHTTPQALRLAWYDDMISLFDENNIAWANWDFKGGFAPICKDGLATDIIPVILK
jgi:endoglucanase